MDKINGKELMKQEIIKLGLDVSDGIHLHLIPHCDYANGFSGLNYGMGVQDDFINFVVRHSVTNQVILIYILKLKGTSEEEIRDISLKAIEMHTELLRRCTLFTSPLV